MKKILVALSLFALSLNEKSQTPCGEGLYPTIDSLRSYINIYIRNSPISAFTSLRLNTAMVGISQWLDCIEAEGAANANTAAGIRILNELSQEIKTLYPEIGMKMDTTSTSGGITVSSKSPVFKNLGEMRA